MKENFPNDFPKDEERKPYKYIIQWYSDNKFKFNTYPQWRKKRLLELKITPENPPSVVGVLTIPVRKI
jgi:hypothetical protein